MSLLQFINESKNSFEGQERGEEIFLLLREHWIYPISYIFIFLLEIVLPIIVINLLVSFLNISGLITLLFFLTFVWVIFVWTKLFYTLMRYTLTTYIVTNERVICNRQLGFFNRKISEIRTNRIQDIKTKINGIWATWLNFGDVKIQTAGNDTDIIFLDNIPNPHQVHNSLMKIPNRPFPLHKSSNSSSPSTTDTTTTN